MATYHKPLLGILGDRELESINNPRIARIKQRTLQRNYDLIYIPGKQQIAADGFSRRKQNAVLHVLAEIANVGINNDERGDTMHKHARYSVELLTQQATANYHRIHESSTDARVADLKAAPAVITLDNTAEDDVLTQVIEQVEKGFPDSSYQVHKDVRVYHRYHHNLSIMDGVLCYKNRVVIPAELRQQVLQTLHSAHQGVTGMINRAEQAVFWPGIHLDICKMHSRCRACMRNAPS